MGNIIIIMSGNGKEKKKFSVRATLYTTPPPTTTTYTYSTYIINNYTSYYCYFGKQFFRGFTECRVTTLTAALHNVYTQEFLLFSLLYWVDAREPVIVRVFRRPGGISRI